MRKRNVALVIILSLVTIGIYQLIWLYQTRKEMVVKGANIPPFSLILFPFVGLAASFILWIANLVRAETGVSGSSDPFVLIAWITFIASIVALILFGLYWIVKYCEAVEKITNDSLGFDVNLLAIIILTIFGVPFIWPGIVQHHFNKIANNSVSDSTSTPQTTSHMSHNSTS